MYFKEYYKMQFINPHRFSTDDSDAFLLTINTALGDGLAEFTLPARNVGTYDAIIDWGDNSTSTITAYNDVDLTHTYSSGGTYQISITGTFPAVYFNIACVKVKVTSIDQ
jgi:hypothetical protein